VALRVGGAEFAALTGPLGFAEFAALTGLLGLPRSLRSPAGGSFGAMKTRVERDSMGSVEVPAEALWGASTQRAVENFPISGERMPRGFLAALGLIKAAAARANARLGSLDERRAVAIAAAAERVASGEWDDQFPVDVFQTGSGTSTNMNANEVIATLARRALAADRLDVHPNDHVNASQSSNDVIPTALHVAARRAIAEDLLPALARLERALSAQAERHAAVVKLGRTHLMDAVPIPLGAELAGWQRQVALAGERAERAADGLAELAIGGTAVGTGLNCPPGFAAAVVAELSAVTGLAFREALDHVEAQSARDAAVEASGQLRAVAVSLSKIASDVRLLASGPRAGLGELVLPALQPGSSIMPGKVNPVLCEVVTQVAAQVVGNDAAIATGGLQGQLQLNAFLPLIARNLLESIALLANATAVFSERCIEDLEVDRERAEGYVERSLALATPLVSRIGYDRAAEIAKQAHASGRSVREVAREAGIEEDVLEQLLGPER
jgi:fumarate hydratase class II